MDSSTRLTSHFEPGELVKDYVVGTLKIQMPRFATF